MSDGGDSTSSTSSSGTTTTSASTGTTTTTDASVTVADVSSEPPPTSVSGESDADTSTSGEETATTGNPDECGCPPDTPIGLDDPLPDGETAAELLARFADLELPLTWIGYGDATTMVHFDVQYRGAQLYLGPGGEDGCAFLSAPCNEGLQAEVAIVVTTDDGWLSLDIPAQVTGFGESAMVRAYAPIAQNQGTLVDQPLPPDLAGLGIGVLYVSVERTDLEPDGLRGSIDASVSVDGCGAPCEVDDDCNPPLHCGFNLCVGNQLCNVHAALGAF